MLFTSPFGFFPELHFLQLMLPSQPPRADFARLNESYACATTTTSLWTPLTSAMCRYVRFKLPPKKTEPKRGSSLVRDQVPSSKFFARLEFKNPFNLRRRSVSHRRSFAITQRWAKPIRLPNISRSY